MGELVDWIDKVKRYYRFSSSELRAIIITVIALGFVISFRDWGSNEVNLGSGFFNFFMAIIIVLFSFLIHDFAIKGASLTIGLRSEYKMWTFGIILAVILAFATNGRFWFLIPGGVIMHHLAGHRLGFFRYGLNYFGLGFSCLAGPIASIFLALIFRSLNSFAQSPILHKAMVFNVTFAIFTVLPIPPADGSRLLYGSRMVYVLGLAFVAVSSLLVLINVPLIFVLLGSFLAAVACWLLYYIFYENKAWGGPYQLPPT